HGAALFLVAELLHAAFASPRVAVRSVRVVGARRVPANAVAELAGVRPGRNIFCVNLALARARVLREPMLRDATVNRSLPATIVIRVAERVPRVTVVDGGRFWEVDEQGIPFRERPGPLPNVPTLELPASQAVEPGNALPPEQWRAALSCLELASRR